MRPEVFTVRQVSEQLRRTLERGFPYVWVQGEVTNLSRPSSGHVYFSLKEEECLLNCVWFRGRQKDERFDPLTGEVWEDGPRSCLASAMETGQTLLCSGTLNAYAARSQYQLIVEHAMPYGMGAWHMEFEALKKKLAEEGLFDQERKRAIPPNPRRVAVVTAPQGAAIRDFLRIAGERGVGAEIRIFPTPVQGEEAPPRIVDALERAVHGSWRGEGSWTPDVIVLIRGGGSIQDLWAFNDERVARAARRSPIPVITGIGHEIDLSITDMASDYAAATPSHAAQLLWTEKTQLLKQTERLKEALFQSMDHVLEGFEDTESHLERALRLLSPTARLGEKRIALESAMRRMDSAFKATISRSAQALERLSVSLSHGSARRFEKDFPLVQEMEYRIRRAGDSILADAEQKAGRASDSLAALGRSIGNLQERQIEALNASLVALNPFAPLKRGYALAFAEDGAFLHSLSQVRMGSKIAIQIGDGIVKARVESLEPSS